MTIDNKVEPYELLVRWEDGRIKGAHFKELSTVTKDGKVIAATEEIRAITTAEVVSILGDKQASILQQIDDKEKEIARLTALVDAADGDKDSSSVSMAQARIVLRRAGLLEQVEATIRAIPDKDDREDALTAWEYSTVISKNGTLVSQLAPLMGLSAEDIDNLFETAKGIKL